MGHTRVLPGLTHSFPTRRSSYLNLSRVHDSLGVQRLLDGPHPLKLTRSGQPGELVALRDADSMLGGKRAAHRRDCIVHEAVDCVDVPPQPFAAVAQWRPDVEMDVAVAKMAEQNGRTHVCTPVTNAQLVC